MSRVDGEKFWTFSLDVYGRGGVADACLRLQDRLGVDVNLLLFGCWVGASGGGCLGKADWKTLTRRTSAWRGEIVEPMRAVRRRLKAGLWPAVEPEVAATLREAVKRVELEAEHAEQLAIATLRPVIPDPSVSSERRRGDAMGNAEHYIAALGVLPTESDRADIAAVATAAVAVCDKM